MIRLLAAYINLELAPRFERLAGEKPASLLRWEIYQLESGRRTLLSRLSWGATGIVRYLSFVLISGASMTLWWVLAGQEQGVSSLYSLMTTANFHGP